MSARSKTNKIKKKKSSKGTCFPRLKKHFKRKIKGVTFQNVVKQIKKHILQRKPDNLSDAIQTALGFVKGKKIKPTNPRVVQIPKTGGVLPLIPIFAGLSALGALTGGVSSVAKAINDARAAKNALEESTRHNRAMEAVAIGGNGLYLKPYKKGLGLFLRNSPRPRKNR